MKIIQIIGPYRGKNDFIQSQNIERARAIAAKYWARGCMVICPQLNSAWLGGACDESLFLEGYKETLSRMVDEVVVLPGWEASEGSCAEVSFCAEHGIHIIYEKEWL